MSIPNNQASRLAKLEGLVGVIATQFSEFIKEAKDHREADQAQLWAAIKEQGNQHSAAIKEQGTQLQAAVEKLSSKGQITWPIICSTLGVVIGLVTAGAGVNNALMEAKIKQTEIRLEYIQKLLERVTTKPL
jgi:hypothetical protein